MTQDVPDAVLERASRAIAAQRRGLTTDDPKVDRVWTSYCGQVRAALAAAWTIAPASGLGKATRSLPRRSTELRDLALAAARAADMLAAAYHWGDSEAACVLRETRATDTRQALLDHLLNHHGMTAAEVKRMKEVL